LRQEGITSHTHRIRAREPSLLTGKLFDAVGNPMSPGHARKKGRSYRYYISQGSLQGQGLPDGLLARIPAAEIESLVMRYSQNLLANDSLVSQIVDENS